MRTFDTGATRDSDENKPDYEGFLHPLFIEHFGAYMHKHRLQADGKLRDSDNWQKGIPTSAYMKSLWRHFLDVWKIHRGYGSKGDLIEACCSCIFNLQGLIVNALVTPEMETAINAHLKAMAIPKIVLPEMEKAPSPAEKRPQPKAQREWMDRIREEAQKTEEGRRWLLGSAAPQRPYGEKLGGWVPGEEAARVDRVRRELIQLSKGQEIDGLSSVGVNPGPRSESSPEVQTCASGTVSPPHPECVPPLWSRQLDRPAEPSLASPPAPGDAVDDPLGPTPQGRSLRPSSRRLPPAEREEDDYYHCGCD